MSRFFKNFGLGGFIFVFLFISIFSTIKSKIISESLRQKYAIGAAVGVGTTIALVYLVYCYLTEDKKEYLQEIQEFSLKLDEQKLEEQEIKKKESGIVSSILKFAGITVIPAAAAGGLVYRFLKDCTPAGRLKEIKKQNKNIRSRLLKKFRNEKENFLEGDFLPREIVDDFIKLNFGRNSAAPLAEAYFYLKKQLELLNKSRMMGEELDQKTGKLELTTKEQESLKKLMEENLRLIGKTEDGLRAVDSMRNKGLQAQFKRYKEWEEKENQRQKENKENKEKFVKNVLDWWLVYKAVSVASDIAASLV